MGRNLMIRFGEFISFPYQYPNKTSLCSAAKFQTGGPVKKRTSSTPTNKKRRKDKSEDLDEDFKMLSVGDVDIIQQNVDFNKGSASTTKATRSLAYHPQSLPKPLAGFVVDDTGKMLMVSNKRTTTIVDFVNNKPLECVIRWVFKSSRGDECMMLCPVDMSVQILKSKRSKYQCNLLTRGVGGFEMENRKAEEWASQLQCWSLYLLNCFACKERSLDLICQQEFLEDLCGMWGGLLKT